METFLEDVVSNAVIATCLALAVAFAVQFVRRPAVAYWLWMLVLIKLVTPPIFHVPLVRLPRSVEPTAQLGDIPEHAPPVEEAPSGWAPEIESGAGAAPRAERGFSPQRAAVPGETFPGSGPPVPAADQVQPAGRTGELAGLEPSIPAWVTTIRIAWLAVVLGVWLTGSLLWLALAAFRLFRLGQLVKHANPASDDLRATARQLAGQFGLRRYPDLRVLAARIPPLLWWSRRGMVILLPADLLSRLEASKQKALVAHELAHYRRGDHLVRWAECAILAAYWWHPVVWWARRRLHRAEEQCCDAWVLWSLPKAEHAYAETLLATVEFLCDVRPALPAIASGFEQAGPLRRRLETVLKERIHRRVSWSGFAAVAAVALAVLPWSMGTSPAGTTAENPSAETPAAGERPNLAEAARLAADDDSGTVYLDKSFQWELGTKSNQIQGQLRRELFRQALLIAARDELGLATRDAWLGDPMPREGGRPTLDFEAVQGQPAQVRLFGRFSGRRVMMARAEVDTSEGRWRDYGALLVQAERLSRTEFVDVLGRVHKGHGGPNPQKPDAAVPAKIDERLGEMTFTSQFEAIRALHQLIGEGGESPARLGALVRAYANLGVLTEVYCCPAHKVFKARALLYAQRLSHLEARPGWAKFHRAYAFALTGIHNLALDDLEAGLKEWRAVPEAERKPRPPWTNWIGPLCRYDLESLDPAKPPEKWSELVHLWGCLVQELACGKATSESPSIYDPAIEKALDVLENVPECYRVYDGLCGLAGVRVSHSCTIDNQATLGENLYRRIAGMAGVPEPVLEIANQPRSTPGPLDDMLGPVGLGFEEEFRARARLIEALSEAEESDAGGEPSWACLGHLVSELSFLQVWRRVHFIRYCFGDSADDFLQTAEPLIAGHPHRAFLSTYAWDPQERREAVDQWAQVEPRGIEFPFRWMADVLYDAHSQKREDVFVEMFRNRDDTAGDLTGELRADLPKNQYRAAKLLLKASYHSPPGRACLIDSHWDEVEYAAGQFEREGQQHPVVLMALGSRYMQLGRYADAERCLRAALTVSGDAQIYEWLAGVYGAQGDRDRWQATMKESLEQPDYGLSHGRTNEKIAWHHIGSRDWDKALPHAQQAAATYAYWGLRVAAACCEGLQDWQQAEGYLHADALRYTASRPYWYFFCRRTGKGDLEWARRVALPCLEDAERGAEDVGFYDLGAIYLLEGQPEKALAMAEEDYDRWKHPASGLFIAVLADDLDDAAKRDEALKRVVDTGADYTRKKDEPAFDALIGLAKVLADDLAAGGKAELDLAALDKLRPVHNVYELIPFDYYLGYYLDRHGKPEHAITSWKRCMGATHMNHTCRTLAGAELLARNVGPDEYKSLLQPEAAENGVATDAGRAAEIEIKARCDGRDRLIVFADRVEWKHLEWSWPKRVTINGSAWDPEKGQVHKFPEDLRAAMQPVDFRSARLAQTKGRHVVSLACADDRVTLLFNDQQPGADDYEVTVRFLHPEGLPRPRR
jgi:beta-lactamase regulating signal transducer with metallopeptidase domain/tetratricopeptide (TPR) repeat protein